MFGEPIINLVTNILQENGGLQCTHQSFSWPRKEYSDPRCIQPCQMLMLKECALFECKFDTHVWQRNEMSKKTQITIFLYKKEEFLYDNINCEY